MRQGDWNVHPFGCDGVTIRNVTIFSPRWRGNTDGLDPDAQDVWVSPYDNAATLEQSMQAYLDWEIALVEQLKRDGTTAFR